MITQTAQGQADLQEAILKRDAESTTLLNVAISLTNLEYTLAMDELVKATALLVSHGDGNEIKRRAALYSIKPDTALIVAEYDESDYRSQGTSFPLQATFGLHKALSSPNKVSTIIREEISPLYKPLVDKSNMSNVACVRIHVGKDEVFLLCAAARDNAEFSEREIRYLEGLGHIGALALGHADSLELEKEKSKALLLHSERMKELEKVKSDFLKLASHELRGPLTLIKGYVSLIEDGSLGEVNPTIQGVLPLIDIKMREMARMLDNMLEVARMEEAGVSIQSNDLDLSVLIDNVTGRLAASLPAGQTINVLHSCGHVTIKGDTARMGDILDNVIGNAIKYSPNKTPVMIECRADKDLEIAEVIISDSGVGIDKEDLPHIFKKFGRIVNSRNSHINGTGLGLYLTGELVKLHNGKIEVESTPNVGTTVRLSFPLVGFSCDGDTHEELIMSN